MTVERVCCASLDRLLASDCHKAGRGGDVRVGPCFAAVTVDVAQTRPRTNRAESSVLGGSTGRAPA